MAPKRTRDSLSQPPLIHSQPQVQQTLSPEPIQTADTSSQLQRATQFGHNFAHVAIMPNQPQLTRSPALIQRVKGGYDKLKKTDDPEVVFAKALGKELVGTYRTMDEVTEHLGKSKNREALKSASIGLAKAGLNIALIVAGIPGIEVGAEAVEEGMEQGIEAGLEVAESSAPASAQTTRAIQNTTTGGKVKGIVYDKVGTLQNAGRTLLGFVPFVGAVKSMAKGAKLASTSQDDWNADKSVLVRQISDIVVALEDTLATVNLENFSDTEIVTADKRNFIGHTRRTLEDVVAKFNTKKNELINAIEAWTGDAGENQSLLQAELPGDDDDD